MTGAKRNLEDKLNVLLTYFPAVIILGVRQGGKTTLAKNLRPNWKYFDLEKGSDYDYISRDFNFFFKENSTNIILDEVQLCPQLFSELRGVIDSDRNQKGRFILTGSSSFELMKNVSESLAGRVGIVELGTLKMNEFFQKEPPPFYKIFQTPLSSSTVDYLKTLTPGIGHDDVMNFFLSGGYPEPVLSRDHGFHMTWMENYYKTYIRRDIRNQFSRLNIEKYRRFIAMLSALSGAIVNRSQLGRSLDTSEVTVKDYLDIADGSFIWRTIPSFEKSISKSIIKMPRGNFRDSGLQNFLQGIHERGQLMSHPKVGAFFEAFVTEEIIKGLQSTMVSSWDYYYYRTRNGAEVDFILDGPFGTLPVEIKFGIKTDPGKLTSLKKFVNDNHLPLGIVLNNSEEVVLIADKIVQVPASLI